MQTFKRFNIKSKKSQNKQQSDNLLYQYGHQLRPLRNQFWSLVLSLRIFLLKHCKLVWIICIDYFIFFYYYY